MIICYICVMSSNSPEHVKGAVNAACEKESGEELHWYAVRAFRGKAGRLKEDFEEAGWKTFTAVRSVPQLLFVKCPQKWLETYKGGFLGEYFMIYRHKVRNSLGFPIFEPAPIPEEQMQVFMFVTSVGDGSDIEVCEAPEACFNKGEKVRVKEGLYKGAVGVVKRIKRDRKLLVAIEGVVVVAISNIPVSFLEKVD